MVRAADGRSHPAAAPTSHRPCPCNPCGLDKGIPVADVERMDAALKAAGRLSSLTVFPQADHGFLADYRPSYNEAAAKEGWAKALNWLKRNV